MACVSDHNGKKKIVLACVPVMGVVWQGLANGGGGIAQGEAEERGAELEVFVDEQDGQVCPGLGVGWIWGVAEVYHLSERARAIRPGDASSCALHACPGNSPERRRCSRKIALSCQRRLWVGIEQADLPDSLQ